MSLKPVLIIGAGDHAGVLIHALRVRGGFEILGIVDINPKTHGKLVQGLTVLGGDEIVFARTPQSIMLVNAIGSVGDLTVRRRIFERFKEKGYTFEKVIHPTAILADDVQIGEGAQIMAGAIIQNGAIIGPNAIINTGAIVDHDGRIGAHCHLAPGVTLSGAVSIGAATHIGTGACVIQGVKIGAECVIGAGSVVVKDVIDRSTALGVPARVVREGTRP